MNDTVNKLKKLLQKFVAIFVNLNQIYFTDQVDGLIDTMKTMENYGHYNTFLNNKTFTSYLKYCKDNGYDTYSFYADQLIYLVFDLVVKNKSFLNKGFINLEVRNIILSRRIVGL